MSKSSKLTCVSKSKDEAVQWLLTKVSKKSGTPLTEMTDATENVAYVVGLMDAFLSFEELLDSMMIILSVMCKSAGAEYPGVLGNMEPPTKEDVKRAYDFLSDVDTEVGAFESLSYGLRRAMDIVNEWRDRLNPTA